jgi:hypothetical protein
MIDRYGAAVAAASLLLAAGCTHQIQTTIAPDTSFYRESAEKIPGRYAIFIQSGTWGGKASVSTWQCGAHSYAFNSNYTFQQAVMGTLQRALAQPVRVQSPIAQGDLAKDGYAAQIAVHTAGFKPQIAFQAGFMTAKAVASVDATVQVVGVAPDAKLFQWSLQGSGQGVGPDSGFCGGGDQALSQAMNAAAHQIMDRLGERIANSEKLREAAADAAKAQTVATPAAPHATPASAVSAPPPSGYTGS